MIWNYHCMMLDQCDSYLPLYFFIIWLHIYWCTSVYSFSLSLPIYICCKTETRKINRYQGACVKVWKKKSKSIALIFLVLLERIKIKGKSSLPIFGALTETEESMITYTWMCVISHSYPRWHNSHNQSGHLPQKQAGSAMAEQTYLTMNKYVGKQGFLLLKR